MIISVLLAVIEIAVIVLIVRGFLNRQAANQARCLVNMLCNTDKVERAWSQAAETLRALYVKTPGRIGHHPVHPGARLASYFTAKYRVIRRKYGTI